MNNDHIVSSDLANLFTTFTNYSSSVWNLDKLEESLYEVSYGKGPVTVRLVDVYVLGIADVAKISDNDSNIDVIIVMNRYNSYTQEAKMFAANNDIKIYSFEEYLVEIGVK